MSLAHRLAVLLGGVLLVLPASAQTVDVRGTVTDGTDPILRARVTVQAGDATGDTLGVDFTDANGDFAVAVQGTPTEAAPAATEYAIGEPFPNPMTGALATVRFTTPGDRAEQPAVETFDLLGRRTSPGARLGAGAYLVRLRFADGSVSATRRLIVTRGGTRVVAEQTEGRLGAPAIRAAARAAQVVFVTVERAGFVTETRTVDAAGGADLGISLGAAPAPTAQIADPGAVQAGTALTLDGTASAGASGEALRYSWAFGDGTRGGTARVAHVYPEAGTYTVTLTVQGDFGATASTTAQVTVTAAPEAVGTAPVRVVVTGTTGGVVVGATASVVGGTASATTDGDGIAVLDAVPTGVPVALAIEKDGFAAQRVALDLPEAAEQTTTVDVTLGARRPAQTMRDAEQGGAMAGTEGVRVEIPVEGLVHADGTLVTGEVAASLTPVDISDDEEIGAFPGAFAGVTPDGPADLILSYGTAEYVFEQNGEVLNLAPGKTATVEIPIYVAEDANGDALEVGDPFPLWSLDETTGEWVLEGEGTVVASEASPTGLALRAEVTHFSWWNCDVAPDPYDVVPECTVEDVNGAPTLQLDETCYIEGEIESGPGPRTRPHTTIGPSNSTPLPVPPGVDVRIEASARGGTLRGSVVVNGEPGGQGTATVVLRNVGNTGGGSIAPDTTFTNALNTLDEVDTYTFVGTAGRYVQVTVGRGLQSSLNGSVTVTAPSGEAVGTQAFGNQDAQFRFQPEATGLFTITVSATSNAPGTYDVDLTERGVEEIAVGDEVTRSVGDSGTLLPFSFEGTAGQPLDLYASRDGSVTGIVRVYGPDGAVVTGLSVGLTGSGFATLPSDGVYLALVDVQRGPGSVTLALRDVPTVALGEVLTGTLRQGERRSHLFEAAPGSIVRPGIAFPEVTASSGSASILPFNAPSPTEYRAFNIQRLGGGTYRFVVIPPGSVGTYAFEAAVAPIAAPTPLTLDAQGRAEVTGEITIPGDVRLYQVVTPDGSGLVTRLSAAGDDPLSTAASVEVGRVLPGQSLPRAAELITTMTMREMAEVDGSPVGLLETFGARLDQSDTFVIAVGPMRQLSSSPDLGATPTGTFALHTDVVAPATAIEVDDDLAECASADTRSLHAAMFAATASTTVTACAGRYAEAIGLPILAGATVEGTDQAAVIVARDLTDRNNSIVIDGVWREGALTLRDLTIEATYFGTRLDGPDLTVERVTIRPAPGVEETLGGFQASGANARFEDVRVEDTRFGVVMSSGTGAAVRNSFFSGASTNMVYLIGNDVTVQGNTFEMTDGQALRVGTGTTGGAAVLDNVITVDGTYRGYNSTAVAVTDGGTSGPSAVRGNVISVATGLSQVFSIQATNGGEVLVEGNEVSITRQTGAQGLFAAAQLGGTLVVRNNVFDGVRSANGIDLFSAPDARLAFVNNSVRTASDASTSGSASLVTPRGTAGALPITVVNNVLQGVGGFGVYTDAGRTVTSDHNLFFGFAAAYGGDATSGGNDVTGEDPAFVDDRLDVAPSSPAVDAGTSAYPDVPATDIDGTARPQGAAVDIGAHEQ